MSTRRMVLYFSLAFLALVLVGIPIRSQFLGTQQNGDELIAGRNVNMVSGTKLPLGDPWLQRQNEPSMVVTSRSSWHLFGAGNDYRTIDMPDPNEVRGIQIPKLAAIRDAWIGTFISLNGGESFYTMLLPGFPQDRSLEGVASPIHGFDTACDPIVRAGANGLLYLSGIAFNRSQNSGAVFVARYADYNDREKVEEETDPLSGYKKYVGPIRYIDTRLADAGNPGQFIDMPNMAVDVPRAGSPYGFGNVYLAYTVFLGNSDINVRSKLVFRRSIDGGATWSGGIKLTESQHIIQRPVIVIDPSDPNGKTIYVVFRRFSHGTIPDGIVLVKSVDGGLSFSKPVDVAPFPSCPFYAFDQWTKGDGPKGPITSFRTNSYPTMAVDGNGVAYIAWAQRYGQDGLPNPDGQARIVISYSTDRGLTWSAPQFVDFNYGIEGHQFMPSMTCAGGKITLIWYDQRDDIALHDPDKAHAPRAKFIEDVWGDHRHTIDVRAAEAPALVPLSFDGSIQVSRYLFFMQLDEKGEPYMEGGYPKVWQGEFSYECEPLFWLGTKPFHGDYIEAVSSPQILPPPVSGSWAFNTNPAEPTIFHGVWTDNRNVWPPGGDLWGDWVTYNPPTSTQDGDFYQQNPCANKDTTGMRNQNIYTASLNHGVIVGSPGNTKQLDIQRSFVVFVKDTIGVIDEINPQNRSFRLTLDEIGVATASFDQFDVTVKSLDITVPPYSSVSSTVYVNQSGSLFTPVRVNVFEGVGGPLVGYVILNPDSTNNPILDPDGKNWEKERHNPIMSNPKIWKYDVGNQKEPNAKFLSPRGQNPRGQNSGLINPRGQNSGFMNPRGQNSDAMNPRGQNENMVNSEMYNPRGQNFSVENTALTDMTWTVSNDGNTTSAYSFNIASNNYGEINQIFDAGDLIAQVLVYKVHATPIDSECELFQTHADELIVNVTNPRGQNPSVEDSSSGNFTTLGADSTIQQGTEPPDITFYLAPGEEAEVVLRVYDTDTTDNIDIDTVIVDHVAGETAAEAANTGDTTPIIVTQPDPPEDPYSELPSIGVSPSALSYGAVLGVNPADKTITVWNSGSGTLNYTIWDDADWLTVSPLNGTSHDYYEMIPHTVSVDIAGLTPGSYSGTITIADPYATNNPMRVSVDLVVYTVPPPIVITRTSVPDGVRATPYSVYIDCSGGIGDITWTVSAGALPSGLNLLTTEGGTGWITGTPTAAGYFEFTVQARDEYPQTATQALSMTIADWVARYNGPENIDDHAYAMAVDSLGNVYVTGQINYDMNGDYTTMDCATIKYNSAGVEQWAATYNGPGNAGDDGESIAVDALGNVYVTGVVTNSDLNQDYGTIKYNSAGVEQWVARYNGPGNWDDQAKAIAVDSSGNVYVTGWSRGSGTDSDYATIKYNSAGVEQWVARYEGPGNSGDAGGSIALDSLGNVYVTGFIEVSETDWDYATVKYNSAGVEQWVARYDGPAHDRDFAVDIAVDSSGNVYVTGSIRWSGTTSDYGTIKYNSAGVEQWVARYDGPGHSTDRAQAIAIDSSGNVYVTGPSRGDGTSFDYGTIKYNSAGVEQWVGRYNGPGNTSDLAWAIAVDLLGNVYVTGSINWGGADADYATIKYDSEGVEQWVAKYNGPGNSEDDGYSIALDSLGNVYATGWSTGDGTNADYATIKYSQSFPETLLISTETLDIGYVGVPYAATVWAFGGSGSRLWSIISGALPPGMDLSGGIGRIVGTPNTAGTYNFTVQVVDGDLTATKPLSMTISTIAGPLDNFIINAPERGVAGSPFSVTITAKDAGGNTTTNVTGATALTVDSGTITPTSIPDTEFRDDGVWTGNVTLSAEGNRTITATNSGKTGSDIMRIWTLIISATDPNEGTILDGKDFESIHLYRMNTSFRSAVKFYENIALSYPFYVYADVDADSAPEIQITCGPTSFEARTYPAGELVYVGTPTAIRDTYYMEFVWSIVFPPPPIRIWLLTHDLDGFDKMPDGTGVIIVNF